MVASHPVPNSLPLYRLMGRHPKMDLQVAYCSLGPNWDPEFGLSLAWDVPLLNDYPWVHVPNWSFRPGLGRFFGLANLGLWKLISAGKFDAIAVPGYAYFSFWIAFLAAKRAGVPVLIETDAVELQNFRGGWWWKRWIKSSVVRLIYSRLADIVLVPSTATWRFLKALGIPEDRLILTPYAVDNEHFAQGAAKANRAMIRQCWDIPDNSFVILYCGKLVPWKRPGDVLQAFASVTEFHSPACGVAYLLFVGDGVLRPKLEAQARSLGVRERVRFLGFVNQSKLPEIYAASDMLVLASEHEAWGVVVNEAMACGVPVVVSDRVGARLDLVRTAETGETFPAKDVGFLAAILRKLFSCRDQVKCMGQTAQKRMETWSCRENLQGWVRALDKISENGLGLDRIKEK
jgi:glycosyltransferase involved in cell wall biosynthesis